MIAHITDFNILPQLKDAYKSFSMAYESEIPRMEDMIFQSKEVLIKIQIELEHRLADAERKLANCNNALTLCQAQITYETDSEGNSRRVEPNCRSEENEVRNARKEQKNARQNLDMMLAIIRNVENQLNHYETSKQEFLQNVDANVHLAIEQLTRHQQLANDYLQIKF